jgi:hypothetical protein
MPDEVTKKDLQSLQGYVNKQLKEVNTRIEKAEGQVGVLKDVPTKMDQAMMEVCKDRYDSLQKQISDLQAEIAALKKAKA